MLTDFLSNNLKPETKSRRDGSELRVLPAFAEVPNLVLNTHIRLTYNHL